METKLSSFIFPCAHFMSAHLGKGTYLMYYIAYTSLVNQLEDLFSTYFTYST